MNPLLVPELFLRILDCLTPPPNADYVEATEWNPTLAALAQTCRAFAAPSLDLLWRRLHSLLPLMRSFSGVADKARVKAPSTADEWHIVNRYLPRIQWLQLGTRKDLELLRSMHLVLPNLKVFRWRGLISDAHVSTPLLPLFTPNIDTLDVFSSVISDGGRVLSFLNDYIRFCPNLRSIKFDIPLRYPGLHAIAMEPLSRTLCSRVDWERVEISYPIDSVAFKHLAKSSTLRVASFNLDPHPKHADGFLFEPTETPFPNVTSLSLTFQNHSDVATNLLRARDQAFHSLAIHAQCDETTATKVSALFAAMPSSLRIHSLRSLKVQQPFPVSRLPDDTLRAGLSYQMFLPVTSLVHLRELVISLHHPISIDDHEFAKLISNWPRLEVLHFVGIRDERAVPSLSLTALTFLASCKDLRRVAITLDARRVAEDVAARGCCSSAVTSVKFVNCPIGDPELVVDFVAKHAPLARVYMGITRLPERMIWKTYDESWKQVRERTYGRLEGNAAAR